MGQNGLTFVTLGKEKPLASCFLLGDGQHWILLDCGAEHEYGFFLKTLEELGITRLDAVLISHAHKDHINGLVQLVGELTSQKILLPEVVSTPITKAIAKPILSSMIEVRGEQKEILHKLLDSWTTINYNKMKKVAQGITFFFIDANHIPGSASIIIDWNGRRLLYTGDVNAYQLRFPGQFDDWLEHKPQIMFVESTYGQEAGAKADVEEIEKMEEVLVRKLDKALRNGGRVLFPVSPTGIFELMLTIAEARAEGKIPKVDCYSIGLQNKIIRQTINTLKQTAKLSLRQQDILRALEKINKCFKTCPFPREGSPHEAEQFINIRSQTKPAVLVAEDGQLSINSASASLATKLLNEKHSKIFLVGYADEDTTARLLLGHPQKLKNLCSAHNWLPNQLKDKIDEFRFRNHIHPQMLIERLREIKPQQVLLVHGSPPAQMELNKQLSKEGMDKVECTKPGKVISLQTGEKEAEPVAPPAPFLSADEVGVEVAEVFQDFKQWLSEHSATAKEKLAPLDAPAFAVVDDLPPEQVGYLAGQEIYLNGKSVLLTSRRLRKTIFTHLFTHYIMDVLDVTTRKGVLLTPRDERFAEGAAEYLAYKYSGKTWLTISKVGCDGKPHYAIKNNPYLEGLDAFEKIEHRYGLEKAINIIIAGTVSEFEKFSTSIIPTEEVMPVKTAKPPLPSKKKPEELIVLGRGVSLRRKLGLVGLGIFVVALVLALAFPQFLSAFFGTAGEKITFKTEGLPEILTSGNYTFVIVARVDSAPVLVETSFILSGNFSFININQASLELDAEPHDPLILSIEDLTGDGESDWIAKRNFEFYVVGNYSIPAKLSVSVSMPSKLSIKSRSISVAPVSITFQLKQKVDKHIEILEVDGKKIYCSEFPVHFTWRFGSQHNVTWKRTAFVSSTQMLLFEGVTGIVNERNASFYTPSSGGNITAEYSTHYTVQFSIQGEGEISVSPGTYWVQENTTLEVVPTPSENTIFEKWLVNDMPVLDENLTIVVDEPLKITAVFVEVIKVTFDAVFPGEITDVILTVDGEEFTAGDLPQTFLWRPVSMHSFCWEQQIPTEQEGVQYAWHHSEGLKTTIRETGYMTSSGNITAFYEIQYWVSINVSPSGSGRASPFMGEKWIFKNETIELSASPFFGYHFEKWIINEDIYLNSTICLVIDQPYTITLYFSKEE